MRFLGPFRSLACPSLLVDHRGQTASHEPRATNERTNDNTIPELVLLSCPAAKTAGEEPNAMLGPHGALIISNGALASIQPASQSVSQSASLPACLSVLSHSPAHRTISPRPFLQSPTIQPTSLSLSAYPVLIATVRYRL